MLKNAVSKVAGHPIVLMDSITSATAEDAGAIVVSASHGGTSSGEFALRVPLAGVFFNDAGIGKDGAGVMALAMLQERAIPAAAVSHASARIGDAADMWENGRISRVNRAAAELGIDVGDALKDAVQRFDRPGRAQSQDR